MEQLNWDSTEPWNGGCRGLELDINQSEDGNYGSVGHVAATTAMSASFRGTQLKRLAASATGAKAGEPEAQPA